MQEINENCYLIKIPIDKDIFTSSFLIKGKKNLLIDSGLYYLCEKYIIEELEKRKIYRLEYLINTHCHPDHIGGNHIIKKHFPGVKVVCSIHDRDYIEDFNRQFKERWDLPLKQYSGIKMENREIRFNNFKSEIVKTVDVDISLKENFTIDLGDREVMVLELPGHTSGTVAVLNNKSKTLFVSDAVQGGGIREKDIPFLEDIESYISSIRLIKNMDLDRIVLSHPYRPFCDLLINKNKIKHSLELSIDYVLDNLDMIAWIKKESTSENQILKELFYSWCRVKGIIDYTVQNLLSFRVFYNYHLSQKNKEKQ